MIAKALVALLAGSLMTGCSFVQPSQPVRQMGELTTVGPVNYTVLESEWRTQLGESFEATIPEHKFLLIRLSVSNAGNQQISVPLLRLIDADEQPHLEYTDVQGVPDWLGLLRVLPPASNLQGTIVFDVPAGDYNLEVTDGGDLSNERTALIMIPLTIRSPTVLDTPGQAGVPDL